MPKKKKRADHRFAILRALAKCDRTKAQLISYLGAQDAYDAVDYDLQWLRRTGRVKHRRRAIVSGYGASMWRITPKGERELDSKDS